jgi:hypothetical protein
MTTHNTKLRRQQRHEYEAKDAYQFVRNGGQTDRGANDNIHSGLRFVLELVVDWE